MERFKSVMGLPWFFTKDSREIPDAVKAKIAESADLDFDAEIILAACFAGTIVHPARLFVVVTTERIVAKRTDSLRHTYFSSLIGVGRSFMQDIVLRSESSEFTLFAYPEMPKKECIDLLFRVINDHYLRLTAYDGETTDSRP